MNQPISTLNLTNNIVTKLENCGFYNCNDVQENLETVQAKVKLPDWTLLTTPPPAKNALELCNQEAKRYFTTFIPELDTILIDEINQGCITELTGLPGSGKTQICLHLAVGVKGEAIFIHINKNLNPERLKEIAEKYTTQAETIMDRLLCIEATNLTEFLASIHYLENWVTNHNIKLVIIDSISWLLRQHPYTERSSFIYTVFQDLRILANKYGFGIVITNDLTVRINGSNVYNSPAFGDSFYHAVNNRILLSREVDLFSAKIVKGVKNLPSRRVFYKF